MAFVPLRNLSLVKSVFQAATYTTLLKRPYSYKSAISLETLYPNSTLKLSTPSLSSDPTQKFSGFIPMDKLEIKYSASSGPGGQNVNKVHTKVDLRFKLSEAEWLHPDVRAKLLELQANKLTKDGYLIIRSDVTRFQQLNLADCLRKLRHMIWTAMDTKKEASPESQERVRQSEAMRALGFPKPISMESFREPNFPLVEEVLRWMAERAGRGAALAGGGGTLEQRVELITHATGFFLSRLNVKLNGRKLYGADGWSVRELLKLATLLRGAGEAPRGAGEHARYDVSARLGDIKEARKLATEITATGSFLYELLAKEPEYKEARETSLGRPLDMSSMEATIRRAIDSIAARVSNTKEQIDNVAASEAALDAKLERRRAELQRAEKRLHTVQKIKPAYQGELTLLESEIEVVWDQYVLLYRCVEALKQQLSLIETAQNEAAAEQQAAIMQLIHKYEMEDVLGKLSDSDSEDSSEKEKEVSETKQPARPATRPRTRLRVTTAAGGAGGGAGRGARGGAGGGAGGGSPEHIRDELDSDSDLSDDTLYLGGAPAPRWPRARPATRPARDPHYADLSDGVQNKTEDSLGSSSESELRVTSAAPPRDQLTDDDEF